MILRRWRGALFVLAAGFLLATAAQGQTQLDRSVIGSGATAASNAQFLVAGTIGQSMIGRGASSTNNGQFGFWYTLPQRVISGVRQTSTQTASGSLRVYPNPVSDVTSLRIVNRTAGRVTLKIVDALGRERRMMIDEVRGPGSFELELDVTSLESGNYSAILNADGAQHVTPIRVIR